MRDDRSLLDGLIADGRPLLSLTGVCLILSGGFALFLSATGHFLPHDVQFLGMTAEQLCRVGNCRIVHFMFHDRTAFGGALIAVGILYLWLAEFPLRARERWAWNAFVISGFLGFGSFLAYLGYGYLDTWHGVATLFLLPCFLVGMWRSRRDLGPAETPSSARPAWTSSAGIGRALLLATAGGMIAGGLTILVVGSTAIFVPQDLTFIGLQPDQMQAINPRLLPLIAHDRAGFGGGIMTCGVLVALCVWFGTPSKSLWQTLAAAGTVGFGTAIGVHPVVGYNDFIHLAPACLGALIFLTGMGLSYAPMYLETALQPIAGETS